VVLFVYFYRSKQIVPQIEAKNVPPDSCLITFTGLRLLSMDNS